MVCLRLPRESPAYALGAEGNEWGDVPVSNHSLRLELGPRGGRALKDQDAIAGHLEAEPF